MSVFRGERFRLPVTSFVLTALLSLGVLLLTSSLSLPLWMIGTATILPWLPLFMSQVLVTYRQFQWLALFYALVVTQTGHFFEHVSQMVQLHLLRLTGVDAQGIIGTLDIEWVHFLFNTWVLVAVLMLLAHFRNNGWLWLSLAITGWHFAEHAYILSVYLATGISGTPGLLSQGGAIGGGLPLARPDLHFVYNLIETIPLIVSFLVQSSRLRVQPSGGGTLEQDGVAEGIQGGQPQGTTTAIAQPSRVRPDEQAARCGRVGTMDPTQ